MLMLAFWVDSNDSEEHTFLKMEVVCSSKTLVSNYKSTRCYYPEVQHQHLTAVRTSNLDASKKVGLRAKLEKTK
jgi:hypothetical protein